MDTEADWVRAIYEQPDDDAPRLLFADWLEERGKVERAELIRLQCRRSGGLPYGDTEDQRVDAVLARHRRAWTSHLPHHESGRGAWRFRRGFPEELEIELKRFVSEWGIWSRVTTVRSLYLLHCTHRNIHEFLRREWNPHWRVLRLLDDLRPWSRRQPDQPCEILRSPKIQQLREIHFISGVGPLLEDACSCPYLDRLEVLGVDRGELDDPRLQSRFRSRLVEATLGDAG